METKTMIKIFGRYLIAVLITIYALSVSTHASDADYQEAVKALEAKNNTTALHYLELAVTGDPDNLKFASEYRQAIIRGNAYDRSLQFFAKLIAEHPNSANLHLNYGFAYVDKIPVAGSITQVILANNALTEFSKAVELQPNWIAYYTRGASYLFWPKIFNRTAFGVADLQKALELQKTEPSRSYHVKTYIALGDGYWKSDELKKARATWREGLKKFPNDAQLKNRLSLQGEKLKTAIEAEYDPNQRVDTNLRPLWEQN
jgi:tetratricopeptide (TPR) repeat protein